MFMLIGYPSGDDTGVPTIQSAANAETLSEPIHTIPGDGCLFSKFLQFGPFDTEGAAKGIKCFSAFPITFKIFQNASKIMTTFNETMILTVGGYNSDSIYLPPNGLSEVFVGRNLDSAPLTTFRAARLQEIDFTGVSFRDEMDFSYADLTRATCINIKASKVYFTSAKLVFVVFQSDSTGGTRTWNSSQPVTYTNNETTGTFLYQAKFNGADLRGADLSDAYLWDAQFINANLSAIDDGTGTIIPTNLSGANLSSANLSGADLSGATLTGLTIVDTSTVTLPTGYQIINDPDNAGKYNIVVAS